MGADVLIIGITWWTLRSQIRSRADLQGQRTLAYVLLYDGKDFIPI